MRRVRVLALLDRTPDARDEVVAGRLAIPDQADDVWRGSGVEPERGVHVTETVGRAKGEAGGKKRGDGRVREKDKCQLRIALG